MTISTIGRSLTAAGVALPHDVFRNPNLDRLTPIQVTKDGRVYGHLAGWKTNHIGFPGQNVKPPRSNTDYRYFHQGVVPTTEGDLPVGYLTLGTGHAGTGDAVQAAAHYDNTGSQVACVRAGEDEHGIWIAGSVLPGTDDIQAQTLRRSSLSGDWRRIEDPDTGRESLELVAALAVNVPGFPIPRTEQLVAAGGMPTMLVAAGIVRNGPITRDEMVAAANEAAREQIRITMSAQQVKARGSAVVARINEQRELQQREQLVASATSRATSVRRNRVIERVRKLVASASSTANDLAGRMPPELHRYWTTGVGLARWAPTPTPYRSLVKALSEEIDDMTPEQIKGLAANLYHDVKGEWPGRKSKGGGMLAASAMPPTPADARAMLDEPAVQQLLAAAVVPTAEQIDPEVVDEAETEVETPVHTGGMIALLPADPAPLAVEGGEPVDELHLTLVYLGDDLTGASEDWRTGVQTSVAQVLARWGEVQGANGVEGTLFGRAEFNTSDPEREQCAVWLVDSHELQQLRDQLLAALGDRVPRSDFGIWQPHITVAYRDGYASSKADPSPDERLGANLRAGGSARKVPDQRTDAITASSVGGATGSSTDPCISSGGSGPIGARDRGARGRAPHVQDGAVRKSASPPGDDGGRALGAARDRTVANGMSDARTLHAAGQPGMGDLPAVSEGSDGALPVTETGDDQFVTDVFAAMRPVSGAPVTFDRVRIAIADQVVDIPVSEHALEVPESMNGEAFGAQQFGDTVKSEFDRVQSLHAAGGKRRAQTQEGADKYGVSIGDVIGQGVDDTVQAVDDTAKGVQRDVSNMARAVGEAIFGKRADDPAPPPPPPAPAPKPVEPPPAPKPVENKATPPPTAEPAPRPAPPVPGTFSNEPDTSTPSDIEAPDATIADGPARNGGEPGTELLEEQSPDSGADGGKLVKFENGTAYYDDGTEFSGKSWARSPVLPDMGYDGTTMLEDQSPLKGAEGGDLVEYDGDAGVARYSDGTETDGKQWRRTAA